MNNYKELLWKKKSFIVKNLWKILDLLRVLSTVMGISNPHKGYNLRQFPNTHFPYLEGLHLMLKEKAEVGKCFWR